MFADFTLHRGHVEYGGRVFRPGALVALALLPTAMFLAPQQPRDGGVTAADTAVITGTVVVDEASPRPLGRAIVTISGADLPESRSVISDDAGSFRISNLPAGRLTISATKRGYVSGTFGATRPGRPGTPAQLLANQALDVTVHLGHGAVVAGTIRDASGDPVPGLLVFAVDAQKDLATVGQSLLTQGGRGAENTVGGVLTDDRGGYRIFGLSPGEYVVVAAAQSAGGNEIGRRSTAEVDAILNRLQARAQRAATNGAAAAAEAKIVAPPATPQTLAQMYFPGTASLESATRLTLGAGDERAGLDFSMGAVPVTTIDGVVATDDGQPPANVQLSITPANTIRLLGLAEAMPRLTMPPDASGHFRFGNLVPGHYAIMARANATGSLSAESGRSGGRGGSAGTASDGGNASPTDLTRTTYGLEEIDLSGQPVTGLTIRLRPAGRFGGRVVFDAASRPAPADLTQLRLTLTPASGAGYTQSGATLIGNPFGGLGALPIRADGSFDVPGIAPGSYRIQCTLPPAAGTNWWFRSAIVHGRDVLDTMLDVPLGADLTGAVLTLTDRHSELAGQLRTATGQPAPDYTVIVLPADRTLWVAGARRVKSTRPSTDGAFTFADLPAGDYLLAALTDVEPNEWQKPGFLAKVAPLGVKVSIGVGEKKTQDLQIVRR